MIAGIDRLDISPGIDAGSGLRANYQLAVTLLLAIAAHLFIVFGVSFEMPKPAPRPIADTIDIIVVNRAAPESTLADSREATPGETTEDSADVPEPLIPQQQADEAIAELPSAEMEAPQAPLEAPDETEEARAPPLDPPPVITETPPVEADQPLVASVLEPEQLITEPPPPEPAPPPPAESPPRPKVTAAQILASRDLEIAHLSARIKAGAQTYGNSFRRKAINASTREYKYANYLDAWRKKVERIGNLNYPQEAKRKGMFGNLILHCALRSDGSIETLRIVRSSGHVMLDQAAMDIVRLAAPFAPFPPDIKSETDVLDITRTWQFLRGNRFSR